MRRPTRRIAWLFASALLFIGMLMLRDLVLELARPSQVRHYDFLAFYSAGQLVREGRPGSIYERETITDIQRTIFPYRIGPQGYRPYINPPFAAAVFSPLTKLSYPIARAAWAGFGFVLLSIAGWWLTRGMSTLERVVAGLLVIVNFSSIHALAEGQWTPLLLTGSLLALAAARHGRLVLAGLALATFWLKPQMIVFLVVALLIARQKRVLAGILGGGAAIALIAAPITGLGIYERYVTYLFEVTVSHFTGAGAAAPAVWEGNIALMEGLNGLYVGLFGQGAVTVVNVLTAISTVALVSLYGLAAVRCRPGFSRPAARRMLAAGILLAFLLDPNFYKQYCLLLFVPADALLPLPDRFRFPLLVVVAGIIEFALLDTGNPSVHLFPIVLIGAVVLICLYPLRKTSVSGIKRSLGGDDDLFRFPNPVR